MSSFKIDNLLKKYANLSAYSCVGIALLNADAAIVGPLVPFISSLGGNLIANIIDRLANKKNVNEDEIIHAVNEPSQLTAIKNIVIECKRLSPDEVNQLIFIIDNLLNTTAPDKAQLLINLLVQDELSTIISNMKYCHTSEALTSVAVDYCKEIVKTPKYARINTIGLSSESAKLADQIREPLLNDIFVEPSVIKASSLQKSRHEITKIFDQIQNEELGNNQHAELKNKALRMQQDNWDKIRQSDEVWSVSEIIKTERVVVLLGDPGSGKSSVLKWTLLQLSEQFINDNVTMLPVLITIGDYATAWKKNKAEGNELKLLDYMLTASQAKSKDLSNAINMYIASDTHGVFLLLDGLDEVPKILKCAIVPYIQEFIEKTVTRNNKILITSRFFGYLDAPLTDPATHYAITPFDHDQIKQFSLKWYKWLEAHLHRENMNVETAINDANVFFDAINERQQIKELATNPLLLTMIAVVVRQGKRLPERRVDLYDQSLKQLMTQWEFQRMAARGDFEQYVSIDYSDACELWGPIAMWMHEMGTGAVHEVELKEKLQARLNELERDEKAEYWLSVRGDKCCLLQERGEHIFGFLHQTFQEYLASMSICHDGVIVDEINSYIEDARWHEVIRLACGYLGVICRPPQRNAVTKLIRTILDQNDLYEQLTSRRLFLAASCIADDVKCNKDLEHEIIQKLLTVSVDAHNLNSSNAFDILQTIRTVTPHESIIRNAYNVIQSNGTWFQKYQFVNWLIAIDGKISVDIISEFEDDDDFGSIALAVRWARTEEDSLLDKLINIDDDIFDEVFEFLESCRKLDQFIDYLLKQKVYNKRLYSSLFYWRQSRINEILKFAIDNNKDLLQVMVKLLSDELNDNDEPTDNDELYKLLISLSSSDDVYIALPSNMYLNKHGLNNNEIIIDLINKASSNKEYEAFESIIETEYINVIEPNVIVEMISSAHDSVVKLGTFIVFNIEHNNDSESLILYLISQLKSNGNKNVYPYILNRGMQRGVISREHIYSLFESSVPETKILCYQLVLNDIVLDIDKINIYAYTDIGADVPNLAFLAINFLYRQDLISVKDLLSSYEKTGGAHGHNINDCMRKSIDANSTRIDSIVIEIFNKLTCSDIKTRQLYCELISIKSKLTDYVIAVINSSKINVTSDTKSQYYEMSWIYANYRATSTCSDNVLI